MLDFEQPLKEMTDEIKRLQEEDKQSDLIDHSKEIAKLQYMYEMKAKEIYSNLQPWHRVQIARVLERPTIKDYIPHIFEHFIALEGDRRFGADYAMYGGIAKINNQAVTVVGQLRGKNTKDNLHHNFGMAHPEGYRKALRLMKQANKFNRPIITFVDTKGAFPGKAAEERGQSEAIATNLVEMAGLNVPIITIVIGEGGSGGALGIAVSNEVYMLENSTYSVISPEGAAALLWKDAKKANLAAEKMAITAQDVKSLNVIDGIIEEPQGGAHCDIEATAQSIKEVIVQFMKRYEGRSIEEIKSDRYNKFRQIGEFTE